MITMYLDCARHAILAEEWDAALGFLKCALSAASKAKRRRVAGCILTAIRNVKLLVTQ